MTLNDIIVAALAQLDRGHDAQTLDVWRDKLTRFTNDGVLDLAAALKPRRTDTARVENETLDLGALARACQKVLRIARGGKETPFACGGETEKLSLPSLPDGDVEITYQFVPKELSAATDVPELPPSCHALIVTYVVGRERASGDVSVQRGANVYFQMYEAGKRLLLPRAGGADAYKIVNRW